MSTKTIVAAAGAALAAVALAGCGQADGGGHPTGTAPKGLATGQESQYLFNNLGPVVAAGDLEPGSGTVYMKANDGHGLASADGRPNLLGIGGPWLTVYTVDGDKFTYSDVPCTGHAPNRATGRIEGGKVVWDAGKAPWYLDDDAASTPLVVEGDTAALLGGERVEASKADEGAAEQARARMRQLCASAEPGPEPLGAVFQEGAER
jgi:hypothetical protein